MKEFAATRYESDVAYAEVVTANTEEEAMAICDANDWDFEGEIYMTIPAEHTSIADVQALVDQLNSRKAH